MLDSQQKSTPNSPFTGTSYFQDLLEGDWGPLLCKCVLLGDSLLKNLRNLPVLDPVVYG